MPHTSHLPRAGIATLTMLEAVLPDAAREVERKTEEFVMHFMALADTATRQSQLLHDLLALLEDTGNPTAAFRQELGEIEAPLLGAISGAVISLQFQDHHAQVIAATTSMLSRYREVLEHTHGQRTLQEADTLGNASAARIIADGITLGTLRAAYMEKLGKQGISLAANEPGTDTIELF